MPNFRLLLAALSFIASPLLPQQGRVPGEKPPPLQTGVILPRVAATKQPEQSYALYLPSQYVPDKRWPIVYAFDPGARGSAPLELMKEAAERHGYILVGSNNSWVRTIPGTARGRLRPRQPKPSSRIRTRGYPLTTAASISLDFLAVRA